MSEIKSLADGGELNNETWSDFIERLKYQHHGEGVNQHFTASPIFTVREKVKVTGSDDDNVGIYCQDDYYDDVDEALSALDEDMAKKVLEQADEYHVYEWAELDDYSKANAITEVIQDAYIYYWKWDYKTVNTHLTREAAERFIKRKQHDYGELHVYVESAYWCWELRTIIDGILSGKIKYIGDDNEQIS